MYRMFNALALGALLTCAHAVVAQEKTDAPEEKANFETISAEDAAKLWKSGVFVLDVRTDKEFKAGHLPRAQNIDVAQLGEKLTEVGAGKDEPVLVYCRSGHRSAIASKILADAGFTKIKNMAGGITAWSAAKLDTVRKDAAAPAAEIAAQPSAPAEAPKDSAGCAAESGSRTNTAD